MPFRSPNKQCLSTEGRKYHIPRTGSSQAHPCFGYWRLPWVAEPVMSPLSPVLHYRWKWPDVLRGIGLACSVMNSLQGYGNAALSVSAPKYTPVSSTGNVCPALWCRNVDPLGRRHEHTLDFPHEVSATDTWYTLVGSCLQCRGAPPRTGSGVVRIDPLRFLAGCRTRRLNQAVCPVS